VALKALPNELSLYFEGAMMGTHLFRTVNEINIIIIIILLLLIVT
jgi:uncharacterized membrane protein